MATLTQILDAYADRLIAQYRTMPKARATIEIFGKELIGDDIANALALAFSIDTAVGPQLDTLGKYVGLLRNVGEPFGETLTDEEYRLLLKLRIATNNSDGTLASLQEIMVATEIGTFEISDPQDMSLVYALQEMPTIPLDILRVVLPKPMAIGTSLVIVSETLRCLDDGTTLRGTDTERERALIAG